MKSHKNIWVSRSGGNFTSWQHTKFIGYGNGNPLPSYIQIDSPNTIGEYKQPIQNGDSFYIDSPYGEGYSYPLKSKKVINKDSEVEYFILDSEAKGGNRDDGFFDYNNLMRIQNLTIIPQSTEIKTTNGNVDINDIIADVLIVTSVGFISDFIESQYVNGRRLLPDEEVKEYLDFLRIPINYTDINQTKFDNYPERPTYINGYFYKVTPSSWTNQIFSGINVKDLVNTISLYGGYDYSLNEYKYASDKVIKWAYGVPTSFIDISVYLKDPIKARYYYTSPEISGNHNMLPLNFTNNPYIIPDLPIMGGQNPYEYQCINCIESSSLHRWEHCITRYYFIPKN